MPSVSNAGGSLSSAIVLTMLAWGVRWVRGEMVRRKREDTAKQQERRTPGRFHANLSPASLRMLVETGAYPHIVLDVRAPEETNPLPPELRGSLRLPCDLVAQALASSSAWTETFQGVPFPETHFMLVFVGSSSSQQLRAAAAAASQGFLRTMTLAGTLSGFARGASTQPNLHYVSRDAVAALLSAQQNSPLGPPPQRVVVLDVRRGDERALYGHIQGTVHIPVDRLPSALALSPENFLAQYHFPKPSIDDLVVMSCRTNVRAAWAAALAQDAGLMQCVVFRQGVYGWRLDSSVKVYRGYKQFDPPPEPEPFQLEQADIGAGAAELAALGIGF
jgi:rhodanese-related sulfurtransferase